MLAVRSLRALRSFGKVRMVKQIKVQNKLNNRINFKNLEKNHANRPKLTQCKFNYWDTSKSLLMPEGIVPQSCNH